MDFKALIFVAVLGMPAAGAAQSPEVKESTPLQNAEWWARTLTNLVPSSETRAAVKSYMGIVKPEVYPDFAKAGGANMGLRARLFNKFNDPSEGCFRRAAAEFYKEVHEVATSNPYCTRVQQGTSAAIVDISQCKAIRPSIDRKAGHAKDAALKPGWVWELAMKYAGQDPNAAMQIIGLCGHDDLQQGVYQYVDHEGRRDYVGCPSATSPFFLSGSLGREQDLKKELKAKIKKTQMPGNSPWEDIASKYYHIYGGALTTCMMIEEGVTPAAATSMAVLGARVYRSVRMCEIQRELSADYKVLSQSIKEQTPNQDLREGELLRARAIDFARKVDAAKGECPRSNADWENMLCRVALRGGKVSYSNTIAEDRVRYYLTRLDAGRLFDEWYVGGGKIMGQNIPCTDLRLGGPKDLLNAGSPVRGRGAQVGIASWSKDRYEAASKHLASWETDFEWTREQHRIGAEFAAKHCKAKSEKTQAAALCRGKEPFGTVPYDASLEKTESKVNQPAVR